MGQKTSPKGFRLAITKDWLSNWFSSKKDFGRFLKEDRKIRKYLKGLPLATGAAKFSIKRMSGKIEITIHTSRPGLVIGKKGAEIENLKKDLKRFTGSDVFLEVVEIKRAEQNATLVAEGIAKQIERRMPFRRVLKKALQTTMDSGALGIKVQISGRVGGAEIARTEWYKEGRIPLHTLRADIDYATACAHTTYGAIGVKVWINRAVQ